MAGRKRVAVTADLARTRDRFVAWRKTRAAGSRIPTRLWNQAVKLAGKHGLYRTASVLKLDYYSLKKRMGHAATPATSSFVEVAPASFSTGGECVIEVEDGAGSHLRVSLTGFAAEDVVALARSVWSGK